jgi:hypothetical protein
MTAGQPESHERKGDNWMKFRRNDEMTRMKEDVKCVKSGAAR